VREGGCLRVLAVPVPFSRSDSEGVGTETEEAKMDNERPVRVLFVCHENCNRSQLAEAFARIYGGRSVEAYSAGWRPAQAVDSKAIAAMHELGYDIRRHLPKCEPTTHR